MSRKTLKKAILKEAREYTGIPKLKMSDILEWTTGDIDPLPGEVIFLLPKLKIRIALKKKA